MSLEHGVIMIVLLYSNIVTWSEWKDAYDSFRPYMYFFLDEEESEDDDDDDDDDEEESTEEPPKMEVDNKQKQKKTEETPKTTVRNIQILIACHLTEHWEFRL